MAIISIDAILSIHHPPEFSLVGIGFYQGLGKWHERCLVSRKFVIFPCNL